jgi:hypothetical protein
MLLTEERPLYYIGIELFEYYKFDEILGVSFEKMAKFLTKTESSYRKANAYHNSTHAADVMHSMHFFISQLEVGQGLSIEVNWRPDFRKYLLAWLQLQFMM